MNLDDADRDNVGAVSSSGPEGASSSKWHESPSIGTRNDDTIYTYGIGVLILIQKIILKMVFGIRADVGGCPSAMDDADRKNLRTGLIQQVCVLISRYV